MDLKRHGQEEAMENDDENDGEAEHLPELVWYLYADIYCINYDGSILDASLISLVSAIQNGQFLHFFLFYSPIFCRILKFFLFVRFFSVIISEICQRMKLYFSLYLSYKY